MSKRETASLIFTIVAICCFASLIGLFAWHMFLAAFREFGQGKPAGLVIMGLISIGFVCAVAAAVLDDKSK